MRSLWGVIVVLVICVAGIGFYRGWFSFDSHKTDAKSNITLTVDDAKFRADRKEVTQKVQNLGHEAKEKVAGAGEKSK